MGRYGQVRDQLPEDGRSVFWRIEFLGMVYPEVLVPVFPLFPVREPDSHGRVLDRQHGAMILALRVPESDFVGATVNSVDRRRLSSQRMLFFWSIGTRVGLILRLRAAVTLSLLRDQNFAAVSPSGMPSGVVAMLAWSPQTARF